MDGNLKVVSSNRIKIDKITDENKPFKITYSITLEELESPYKERKVFFTDSENNKTEFKALIGEDYLNIPEINFQWYNTIQSKNNNFILAYNYEYRMENIKNVKGEVAFINQDKLFLISDLQCPNDVKLASNGNFIINDWMSSYELNGTFYAFNSEAEVLIERKFNSNLGNNGISDNGQYAVLETNYSDSDDENKIFFFDLNDHILLWERERDAEM